MKEAILWALLLSILTVIAFSQDLLQASLLFATACLGGSFGFQLASGIGHRRRMELIDKNYHQVDHLQGIILHMQKRTLTLLLMMQKDKDPEKAKEMMVEEAELLKVRLGGKDEGISEH